MKKDLGVVPAVYPMPVLMVAAYDKNEKVNVMNVAWGQICDMDKIILFIGEGKKTWLNIQESKAFTVALADEAHMDVADFWGIASGNKINDKFERTGYHAVKSDKVHAPVIEEFPVVMECELLEFLKVFSFNPLWPQAGTRRVASRFTIEGKNPNPRKLELTMRAMSVSRQTHESIQQLGIRFLLGNRGCAVDTSFVRK